MYLKRFNNFLRKRVREIVATKDIPSSAVGIVFTPKRGFKSIARYNFVTSKRDAKRCSHVHFFEFKTKKEYKINNNCSQGKKIGV